MPATPSKVPPVRMGPRGPGITVAVAVATWAACWFVGNVLGATLVAVLDPTEGPETPPVWVTAVAALGLWIPILVGLGLVSERHGSGDPRRDFGVSFRIVDLLGVPIGVLTQLVLLRLVYWPLESLWPDTFSAPDVERSARDLYQSAEGLWLVVLVLLVVVGAPLVEELLYRGLLQGALARRVDDVVALVVVAVWFAFIHFRPVEYPGLLVIGLVLGACALVTRRLGMSIVAHCAFNATGLAWVATR